VCTKYTLIHFLLCLFAPGLTTTQQPVSASCPRLDSVFVPGRGSSIIQVTRFQIQRFTVSIKELAEWFGLEITRIVVDECLPKRES
jgi:hypothetical protein